MRRALTSSLLATAARLSGLPRDERGNVIVYVSLTAALILGMVGLALDGARGMITNSEAQAAADAAALAGASQLDQQTGACARAKTEASAVTNNQRFAEGGGGAVSMSNATCLSSLPSSDSAATGGFATTNDAASQYLQVTTQQLTHKNTFLDAIASNDTAIIQRTAVAGFHRSLCAAAPVIMVCDTYPWTAGAAYDAWIFDAQNKGWITDASCNSAGCVHDTLAATAPSFCVVDNSVQPVPGNKTAKAADGINTRFGQGSTASQPSDKDVISYPHDNAPAGDGSWNGWDCQTYWTNNHKNANDGFAQPAGCTSTAKTYSRYQMYQDERAQNKIPAAGQPATANTTTAERRLAYIAIFNCANPTTPEGFLKTFLLEPAQGASSKSEFVEVLGLATSKTDPTAIHEEVQLYR